MRSTTNRRSWGAISISDPKEQKRLAVLTLWSNRARGDGHSVPTGAEIAAIAADPHGWNAAPISDVVDAWSPTIAHLLHQIKFGVTPEVAADLPDELCRPSRPLAAAAPPTPRDSGVAQPESEAAQSHSKMPTSTANNPSDASNPRTELLERLLQWRSQRIAEGVEGADNLKDVTLGNLVKYDHTDPEQIRKKLPGPAAYLAAEIAAVMKPRSDANPAPSASTDSPSRPPAPATSDPVAENAEDAPRRQNPEPLSLDLDHSAFSPYEFGESDVEISQLAVKTTSDGVRLTFDPYVPESAKMVIYRVVSGENAVPYKPEAGDLVSVTTGLTVEDHRFATSAVRTYQVWCHVGLDREDACRSQPFLLAQSEAVSPVDDFRISEDEGRVIGQWSVFPGTRAVRVYRIPLNSATPTTTSEHFRICADEPNLTGFVDTTAERGNRYLYRAVAEVPVGESTRGSRPVQHEILVSVVLEPVTDLTVAVGIDDSQFDLTWTAPSAGSVKMYRLAAPPPAGLADIIDEAQLEPQGLNEHSRIKHPVTSAGIDRPQMRAVPWPADWQRAYLVPVTVLNGRARVGVTQITTRALPPVTDMEIVERFHTEVVTFGWPAGAASVKAFVGLESESPEEICTNNAPTEEINESRYRRDGGLTFAKRLASNGCTVCLVPVAYSRGEEIRGRIAAQHYAGLARIKYALAFLPDSQSAQLWLKGDVDVEYPPPLMLINHPDRFPLSADDGQFVYLTPPGQSQQLPQCTIDHISREDTNTGWTVDLSEVHGFYRLFFGQQQHGSRPLALEDPPLKSLYRYPQTRTAP